MDIPRAHPSGIQGNDFFFDAGNVALVFGDQFRFKLAVAVPGDIYLEFPILALRVLGEWPLRLLSVWISTFWFFSYLNMASISASISSWRIFLKPSLRRA